MDQNQPPESNRPIKRATKFFDGKDMSFEIRLGREYLQGDMNMTVWLYQVDRTESNADDLYGEALEEEIVWKSPVELYGRINFDEATLKSYKKDNKLTYREPGNLEFACYEEHLKELDVEICVGDFLGYKIRRGIMTYFEVYDDGLINEANSQLMKGHEPFYRMIKGRYVDGDQFKGL